MCFALRLNYRRDITLFPGEFKMPYHTVKHVTIKKGKFTYEPYVAMFKPRRRTWQAADINKSLQWYLRDTGFESCSRC